MRGISAKAAIAVLAGLIPMVSVLVLAEEPGKQATSYLPVAITEDFASIMARMQKAQAPGREAAGRPAERALRPRRPTREGRHHVARQAGAGRRARQAGRRRHLGRARRDEPRGHPREGRLSRRVPAAAAPQPSRRRHGLPQVPDRRDQEAGGARPHALRPRLRPARPLPARVPAADLPDHAPRPRRRLARASSSRSTTTTSSSTAS